MSTNGSMVILYQYLNGQLATYFRVRALIDLYTYIAENILVNNNVITIIHRSYIATC